VPTRTRRQKTKAHEQREVAPRAGYRLADQLRAHNLRVTPQRQIVLEALFNADGHATAEELLQAAQEKVPGFNIASVYRTLASLEDVALIRSSQLGHGGRVYEIAPAGEQGHQHLVCTNCGKTIHFKAGAATTLRRELERQHAFRVEGAEIIVAGLCPDCAADIDARPPAETHDH
jgi:Fe2+ or Zn2+ uptake regulation protein